MNENYGLSTSRVKWKKSSRSEDKGACVELALVRGGGAVRDSKNQDGPVMRPVRTGWAAFLGTVKTGALDLRK